MKGFNIHCIKLDNKMALNNAKIMQAVNRSVINQVKSIFSGWHNVVLSSSLDVTGRHVFMGRTHTCFPNKIAGILILKSV